MRGKANVIVGALVVAMLAIAVAALVWPQVETGGHAGLKAVVHDGDGGMHELSLAESHEVVIETSLGRNVVAVRDGSVFEQDADCDNHDCMRQGSLDAPGRQIICLPHRLRIEVVAEGEGGGQMDVGAAAGEGGQDGFDALSR